MPAETATGRSLTTEFVARNQALTRLDGIASFKLKLHIEPEAAGPPTEPAMINLRPSSVLRLLRSGERKPYFMASNAGDPEMKIGSARSHCKTSGATVVVRTFQR